VRWALKIVAISLLVAAITGKMCPTMSYAQEAPPPRFQFAQTEVLELSWTELQKQRVEVEIVNNTTKRLNGLNVKLSPLGLKVIKKGSQKPSTVKNSEALTYNQSLSLPSAGSSKITLRAVDPAPSLEPADYAGSITVSEGDTDTVIRRSVHLTVEDSQAKIVPEPLVEDWTVRAYRLFPLVDALPGIQGSYNLFIDQPVRLSGQSLPLNIEPQEEDRLDLMAGKRLGFVEAGQGNAAVVTSSGKSVTMSDDVVGLKLGFDGLGRSGKYEGKVDFVPEDDEAVALAVDVKDIVVWPILAILGGLALGVRAKRYLGKGRKVLVLREREARVGKDFDDAQTHFSKEAKGKPYAKYNIENDIRDQRTKLVNKLNRLAGASLVTLNDNDPDYQTIVKDIERLESTVKAWGSFGDELAALDKALHDAAAKAVNARRPHGWPNEKPEPAFLPEAKKLLDGENVSVESFEARKKKVIAATDLATWWGPMSDKVEKNLELVEELEKHRHEMNPREKNKLSDAKGVVYGVHGDLWEAQNAEEFETRATNRDLEVAIDNLGQLRYCLPGSSPPEPMGFTLTETTLAGSGFDRVEYLIRGVDTDREVVFAEHEAPDDAARAESFAKARDKADRRLWWLALGLALVTGIATLYIGQPFGTFWDYLNAIAWGVGTVLALTALSAALEGLPSVRELLGSSRTPP